MRTHPARDVQELLLLVLHELAAVAATATVYATAAVDVLFLSLFLLPLLQITCALKQQSIHRVQVNRRVTLIQNAILLKCRGAVLQRALSSHPKCGHCSLCMTHRKITCQHLQMSKTESCLNAREVRGDVLRHAYTSIVPLSSYLRVTGGSSGLRHKADRRKPDRRLPDAERPIGRLPDCRKADWPLARLPKGRLAVSPIAERPIGRLPD